MPYLCFEYTVCHIYFYGISRLYLLYRINSSSLLISYKRISLIQLFQRRQSPVPFQIDTKLMSISEYLSLQCLTYPVFGINQALPAVTELTFRV